MKKAFKVVLILSFSIILISFFFIPQTNAQEYTYDGVNTEKIPNFSVYPSEWYLWNTTAKAGWTQGEIPPENYTLCEIIKGNMTDLWQGNPGPLVNYTSIYVDLWNVNATSGEKSLAPTGKTYQINMWNASAFPPYVSYMHLIIPVASNGKVSEDILNNVTWMYEMYFYSYDYKVIYPNIYSFHYWNSTDYLIANYTSDGILKNLEHTYMYFPMPNMTLISEPAQHSPEFSFTTETGSLIVNSTEFKLNISITDVDNNNDGEIDTDYLFRIQNGTEWSDWTTVPNLLDWDLGSVEEGSYEITVEIKNMYGISQEEITINYVPPEEPGDRDEIIPGYPLFLVLTIITLISSILIRKKYKNR